MTKVEINNAALVGLPPAGKNPLTNRFTNKGSIVEPTTGDQPGTEHDQPRRDQQRRSGSQHDPKTGNIIPGTTNEVA